MPDSEDTFTTLDTGEAVRVTPDGRTYLEPGPDPEVADIAAKRQERLDRLEQLRQAQLEALAQKQAQEEQGTPVPPEKRIF